MRWSKSKESILVLVAASLIGYRSSRQPVLLWIAGLLVLIGLFVPAAAEFIHRAWMKLGTILGAITSRVLLTLIFFLVILPFGLISRLLGKNEMILDPARSSFFIQKEHTYTKEDLEHPW